MHRTSRRSSSARAEYRAATAEALTAMDELRRVLKRRHTLTQASRAAVSARRACARLYTAAACIISPP